MRTVLTKLKEIFLKYKKSILLTYTFFIISQLLSSIMPYFFGKMIDDVLNKGYTFLIIYIVIYVLQHLIELRKTIIDSKTYLTIYVKEVEDYFENDKSNKELNVKVSKADLIYSTIFTIEESIPFLLSIIISFFTTLYFLFFLSKILFLIVFVSSLVFIPLFYIRSRKNNKVIRLGNELTIHKNLIYKTNSFERLISYLHLQKKVIYLGSKFRGSIDFMIHQVTLVITVIGLIIYIKLSSDISIGKLISVHAYIANYINTASNFRYLSSLYIQIKDSLSRL